MTGEWLVVKWVAWGLFFVCVIVHWLVAIRRLDGDRKKWAALIWSAMLVVDIFTLFAGAAYDSRRIAMLVVGSAAVVVMMVEGLILGRRQGSQGFLKADG